VHLPHDATDHVGPFQNAAICQQNETIAPPIEQDSASRRLFVFHVCGNFAIALEIRPVPEMAARVSKAVAIRLAGVQRSGVDDQPSLE